MEARTFLLFGLPVVVLVHGRAKDLSGVHPPFTFLRFIYRQRLSRLPVVNVSEVHLSPKLSRPPVVTVSEVHLLPTFIMSTYR